MQKNAILLVLGVLILFMFTAGVPAKTKMIDVVHLKNGNIIKGVVIETIPNESIKIETDDGSISIIEISEVDKIKKIQFVEPKDPLVAFGSGCGTAFLSLLSPVPILGVGQVYNGQYLKGLAFFGIGILGSYLEYLIINQDDEELGTFDKRIGELGATLILGSIVLSPIDAYYSAKRINSKAKKKLLSTTTSLQYIPHQGMMASYSFGF